ncbi:MAG: anthranilate phosphoribosyltransferase [Chloroflexota bacterium]
MAIREAIAKVAAGSPLGMDEAGAAMEEIVHGAATPAQIAAFAVALRMKGETPAEVAGLARVMRRQAVPVRVDGEVVDTCGTGGDGRSTFNISTVAAFVACGAGARVAKHGNRAYSSSCGSADVLEALGVAIDLHPEEVAACVERVGIGFMFAPIYHPAMKHAAAPRREIGVPTVFNVLGPLTNPAGASSQLLGVATASLAPLMGEVLSLLGCRRALVVHGEEGLDEVSLSGPTRVCELREGSTRSYRLEPEQFGLRRHPLEQLKGGSAQENAAIAEAVLQGEEGARRDVVLLNAAAALYAAGRAEGLNEGVAMARESIDSGAAAAKLEQLRSLSRSTRERRAVHVSQ